MVGDEEEGSDSLNCYRFICLNLSVQKVKSLGGARLRFKSKNCNPGLIQVCLFHSVVLLQLSFWWEFQKPEIF